VKTVSAPEHLDRDVVRLADRADERLRWIDVCALGDIVPNCGAPALLGGKQIAIVRVGESAGDDAEVYALSNFDPFSQAFVIARGIVGDKDGRPKIASPIFKQSFDLRTGECLDDPTVVLITYPVRVVGGRIEVGLPGARASS
jgi:nitrite reductase (NADH) small subunit